MNDLDFGARDVFEAKVFNSCGNFDQIANKSMAMHICIVIC
jgi:hypothetical protein